MKRLTVMLTATGLLTAALGTGVAAAAPANAANLTVTPAGTKKAEATWSDWKSIEPGAAFDAYWVVADDDATFTPFTADGVAIVAPSGAGASSPIGYRVAAGSTLTINATKSVVPAGKPVGLYGSLTDGFGAPLEGGDIEVSRDAYPFGDGTVADTVQSDEGGKWSKTYSPLVNTRYSATYTPADGIGGWTRVVTVEARKKISVALDPGATVAAGSVVKFTGTLGGDPTLFTGVQACLQRLDGKWGSLKCVDVDAAGGYLLKFAPGAAGSGKYRVFSGMGPAYGDSWSRAKTLTVT